MGEGVLGMEKGESLEVGRVRAVGLAWASWGQNPRL